MAQINMLVAILFIGSCGGELLADPPHAREPHSPVTSDAAPRVLLLAGCERPTRQNVSQPTFELESLILVNVILSPCELTHLTSSQSLRQVDLEGCLLGNEFGRILARSQSIEELSLVGTRTTDVDLKSVATIPTLRQIDLRGTLVTDLGLEALTGLSTLEYLDVRGTAVSRVGIERLLRSRPCLRVVWDGPPAEQLIVDLPTENSRMEDRMLCDSPSDDPALLP